MTYEVQFRIGNVSYTVRGSDTDGVLSLIERLQGDPLGRTYIDPRKDHESTPWYPDDSGEWVEVPNDCMTSPVSAGTEVEVLLRRERHEKSWTPCRGSAADFYWKLLENDDIRIVAYKVVKP